VVIFANDHDYEFPWVAECPECGSPMYEDPDCPTCIEADYYAEEAA
jgi:hypothetical protein